MWTGEGIAVGGSVITYRVSRGILPTEPEPPEAGKRNPPQWSLLRLTDKVRCLRTTTHIVPLRPAMSRSCSEKPARLCLPGGNFDSFSESSSDGSRRQKRPFVRQHCFTRLPDPQGQRSFRPTRSISSLSPWTIRRPRLTCRSDGNPFRRLLIGSKKMPGLRGFGSA